MAAGNWPKKDATVSMALTKEEGRPVNTVFKALNDLLFGAGDLWKNPIPELDKAQKECKIGLTSCKEKLGFALFCSQKPTDLTASVSSGLIPEGHFPGLMEG